MARFVLAGRPRPRIEETLRIAAIARWALIRRKGGTETPAELLGRDANGPLRDDREHARAFYLPEDADRDGLGAIWTEITDRPTSDRRPHN